MISTSTPARRFTIGLKEPICSSYKKKLDGRAHARLRCSWIWFQLSATTLGERYLEKLESRKPSDVIAALNLEILFERSEVPSFAFVSVTECKIVPYSLRLWRISASGEPRILPFHCQPLNSRWSYFCLMPTATLKSWLQSLATETVKIVTDFAWFMT